MRVILLFCLLASVTLAPFAAQRAFTQASIDTTKYIGLRHGPTLPPDRTTEKFEPIPVKGIKCETSATEYKRPRCWINVEKRDAANTFLGSHGASPVS